VRHRDLDFLASVYLRHWAGNATEIIAIMQETDRGRHDKGSKARAGLYTVEADATMTL